MFLETRRCSLLTIFCEGKKKIFLYHLHFAESILLKCLKVSRVKQVQKSSQKH